MRMKNSVHRLKSVYAADGPKACYRIASREARLEARQIGRNAEMAARCAIDMRDLKRRAEALAIPPRSIFDVLRERARQESTTLTGDTQ